VQWVDGEMGWEEMGVSGGVADEGSGSGRGVRGEWGGRRE